MTLLITADEAPVACGATAISISLLLDSDCR